MAAVTKDVYFIRHGESMYNKWRRESFRNPCVLCCVCDPMLFDAGLSPAGEAQVRALHGELRSAQHPWLDEVELVVTSPLTRAIETCLGAFFPESSYITSPSTSNTSNGVSAGEPAPELNILMGVTTLLRSAARGHGYIVRCGNVGSRPSCSLRRTSNMTTLDNDIWWYDIENVRKGGREPASHRA